MKQPSATEALKRLQSGNRHFVDACLERCGSISRERRSELVSGQSPFAIIYGCSDSRVPAEIIFDQGLGDLFVIRVAGNVVYPSQIGSVEFAVEQFGTPLVVVLGHSCCGAVKAAMEDICNPKPDISENLRSILDRMQDSLRPLLQTHADDAAEEEKLQKAVEINVITSVEHLKSGSDRIRSLVEQGQLMIVGATYDLATGKVDFFHG